MKSLIIASLLALLALGFATVSSLRDAQGAAEITRELTLKCREYRKTLSLEDTRRRLTEDAAAHPGLKFAWPEGANPSMEYKGLRMTILLSQCQGQ
ncbi:MAG: hypothetical protein NDJ89_18805 [Oligoflexia bacterium]|nr:hypothetical protein [Oligoflexia bacterium]